MPIRLRPRSLPGPKITSRSGRRYRPVLALLWFVLAALATLCAPAGASAALACAPATLQQMLAAVPVCQKDADFLAALGQVLNRQGRYLEAADHLERALMLDPGLRDAQLSYAIALTGSGDLASASALLDDLQHDPALPAHLRPLIARQKAMLAGAAEPVGWQSRFTLASRLGFDSNLLGSPNLGSLTLTLAGQSLVLPLDDSYLARSGSYARADAQVELQRAAPDGSRWDAVASLRSRASPAEPKAGSSQIDLLLERSHPGGGSYFNMSASGLRSRAGTRYLAWGGSGGWGGHWRSAGAGGCQARTGAQWQQRVYSDNPVLSGRYIGLSAYWSCESAWGGQWLLGLKAGRDAAQDNARPGGDQRHASLRLAGYLPLSRLQRGGLLFDFEQSQQIDSRGYSPILDSGRTRTTWRRAARLEYQHPISPAAQWVLGAEWVAQTSNLALFQLHSRGGYVGLRVSW